MRIGIFGGSFDPIHYGHLILAEQCREQASLDCVRFVPAAISPLKAATPRATAKQRVEMVELAIAGHEAFTVSTAEIDRGGKSFTVDTLQQFKNEDPSAELFLLIGEDSLASFGQWKEPTRICTLAKPLVVRRPGKTSDLKERQSGQQTLLEELKKYLSPEQYPLVSRLAIGSRLIDISSTDVRQRVSLGQSIRFLVPRSVEKYIQAQRLYAPDE